MTDDLKGQFTEARLALQFVFAGESIFTLKSQATGARYTFRVKATDDRRAWFVSYLTSSDNESGYSYIGIVNAENHQFRTTAKSRLNYDSLPVKAFMHMLAHLYAKHQIAPQLEIWHEGRCGMCARRLTVPESVYRGFGPECVKRLPQMIAQEV